LFWTVQTDSLLASRSPRWGRATLIAAEMPNSLSSGTDLRGAVLLAIASVLGCTDKPQSADVGAVPASQASRPAEDSQLRDLLEVGDKGEDRKTRGIPPRFRNIAGAAGIHFLRFSDVVPDRYFLPEVMGGGVAWFDFDCDGLLDLFSTDGCELIHPDPEQREHVDRLFRNRGDGRFDDVTASSGSGDNRYGQGCAVGDFNADGFPDLYITNYGRNTLLVHNGDGTFDDATDSAGVGDESWGTSAVWFDANQDGFADLYLVNYLNVASSNSRVCTYGGVAGYCGPGQWEAEDDILYLSLGDGRFQTAPKFEADPAHGKGLGVAVCDFDADGRAEIYVANDMAPKYLFVETERPASKGAPLYRDVAAASGCAVSGEGRNEAGMGIACADFDGDGRVDIYLTHYYHHKNTLYRNLGSLIFEDDSRRSRAAATSYESLGFGIDTLDFDHDGDEDLFIANGHVLGPRHKPNEMKQQLLQNNGRGVFYDASDGSGDYFSTLLLGRGAAGGDFDNDGRVDLAVSHLDQPLAVLRNETRTPHHYIGLELLAENRIAASGGRVIVTAGERRREVPIVGGGSYLSSRDPRIMIGLGEHEGPVQIEVVWPGRGTDTYRDLSPDRYWRLCEGGAGRISVASVARTGPEESPWRN
jgi:enediyne biosynthesis protein E4